MNDPRLAYRTVPQVPQPPPPSSVMGAYLQSKPHGGGVNGGIAGGLSSGHGVAAGAGGTLPGPGVRQVIDYKGRPSHFLGARFVFEVGAKLEAPPMTIATAAVMYHKFFKEMDEKNYDIYLIAATCLTLAAKCENQSLKLRDVINVAYSTIHRDKLPLDLNDQFWSFRDAIVQSELLVMRALKFRPEYHSPHKFLVHYLKTLEDWVGHNNWIKTPVARTAWCLLQDFHHEPAIISYPPQAVAVAAVKISMDVNGAQVPLCEASGKNNWQKIMYPDLDAGMQEEIMYKMLCVYDHEESIVSAALIGHKSNGNGH